jgi:hypothetical protein
LFQRARDIEVISGLPFPDSHSAYFTNEELWKTLHAVTTGR